MATAAGYERAWRFANDAVEDIIGFEKPDGAVAWMILGNARGIEETTGFIVCCLWADGTEMRPFLTPGWLKMKECVETRQ